MVRPKQPERRPQRVLPPGERKALAVRARYQGSGEHKDKGWWGGLPKAKQLPGGGVGRRGKQQTTLCPLTTDKDRERATDWVRQAVGASQLPSIASNDGQPSCCKVLVISSR